VNLEKASEKTEHVMNAPLELTSLKYLQYPQNAKFVTLNVPSVWEAPRLVQNLVIGVVQTLAKIFKCVLLKQPACKSVNHSGMIEPNFNPKGDCAEGYHGYLCQGCIPAWSWSGDNKCSKCPNTFMNLLRVLGIGALMVIGVSLSVRQTLNNAMKPNLSAVYLKIFMNHI